MRSAPRTGVSTPDHDRNAVLVPVRDSSICSASGADGSGVRSPSSSSSSTEVSRVSQLRRPSASADARCSRRTTRSSASACLQPSPTGQLHRL